MFMKPLITICIPTFNRARMLREALNSLLDQGLELNQYIVAISDNASMDDTENVIDEFRERLQIVYSRNETNLGPMPNMQKALAMCQTPYFSWLNDDDLIAPGQLGRALYVFQSEPSASLVASRVIAEAHPGALSAQICGLILGANERTPFVGAYRWSSVEWLAMALINTPLCLIGSVFKRSAFLNCSGDWTSFGMWGDRLLLAEMARHGDVFVLPWIGGHYRTHAAQLNQGNEQENELQFHRVTKKILAICEREQIPVQDFWIDQLGHALGHERDYYLSRLKFALPPSTYREIRFRAAQRIKLGFCRGIVYEPPNGIIHRIVRKALRFSLQFLSK